MGAIQQCSKNGDLACQQKRQNEECFAKVSARAIQASSQDEATKTALLGKLKEREKDLAASRRSAASTAVYNVDLKGKLAKSPPCLKLIDTESNESLRALETQLGLPPMHFGDVSGPNSNPFSNEKNGYRAAVFYDQYEDKYVVAFRGTNKNNLVDWKNNINNQLPDAKPEDAPSYFAAKDLGSLLNESKPPVDYTGHSKGGGEVYEAMSVSPESRAMVFNSAGPSPRINDETKKSIAERTDAYQVGGEMLNLMQDEKDPQKTIANMKWLRGQVDSGLGGFSDKAVKITGRDNAEIAEKAVLKNRTATFINFTADEKKAKADLETLDAKYEKDRKAFIGQLDESIVKNEAALKAGKPIQAFAPALGSRTVIGGSPERTDLNIFAMIGHTMDSMNDALADKIKADRKEIEKTARKAEPNFDKKVEECGKI